MKLSFHGAVRGVTGSCYLLEFKNTKILVDCGMFQGERISSDHNFEPFGFNPSEIDAVLVTHGHFDHHGRIPKLIKEGFRGKVFMTAPTKGLIPFILEDALHVMRDNAKRTGDRVLYSEKELDILFDSLEGMNYHTEFQPISGISCSFFDAGHILGSAFLKVQIPAHESDSGKDTTLVFSGDLGNDNVPILADTEDIGAADVVICESTYGDKDHDPVERRAGELSRFISKIIDRKGTLIIPAFSIERTQELLYEIDLLVEKDELPRVSIYLDSPLAIRVTGVYREFSSYLKFDAKVSKDGDFFTFPKLIETRSVDDSRMINNDIRPKIIIAGSGMMTGGRVLHHLKRYLDDKKSGVLIIGYQARGTLGRKIQEGAEKVEIFRDTIPVNAEIKKIDGFSSHGDKGKLSKWLKSAGKDLKKVYLVHGDEETKISFKEYLEQKIEAEVLIPKFQEEIDM